jgi:hypothetical protein
MADITSDDYYKVLGVSRDATENDISRAYKKLALQHHPDKNPDNREQAEEKFKRVSEAYDVLHDAKKRKTYDQFGKKGMQAGMDGGGCSGGGPGMSFTNANDIFQAFFGGGFPDDDGFPMGGMGAMGGMGGMGGMGAFSHIFGNPQSMRPMGGLGGMGMRGFGMPGMGMPGMGMQGMNGMGRSSTQRQRPARPDVVPPGTKVLVHGLQSAPQHNGKVASIMEFDSGSGRYQVQLNGGAQIALRPANFTQVTSAIVTGLKSQPELNGVSGKIQGWAEDKGRYEVVVHGRSLSLLPGNVQLQPGVVCRIEGLASAPQYNGQWGKILEVDEDAGRYQLQLDGNRQLKVRWENVRV